MIKFLKDNYKKILLGLLILALAALLAERFVTQGTFLGYQVRKVDNPLAQTQSQSSKACEKADDEFVGSVLGKKVKRIDLGFADQEKPAFRSVCSYVSNGKNRRFVTIVIRQAQDQAAAKSEVERFSNRDGVEKLDDFYFSSKSRQIMSYDGDKVVTVTVSSPVAESSITSAEASKKIIDKII